MSAANHPLPRKGKRAGSRSRREHPRTGGHARRRPGPCAPSHAGVYFAQRGLAVKFSELVRRLKQNGFRVVKEKGSVRYYGKSDWPRLIRRLPC